MSDLFEGLKQKVSGRDLRIVFPEGLDERIVRAAGRLAA
ncbi:MAG: phosphate acetyltransferase, partial [Bacillus sp. (in: firmicutes)]